MGPADGDFDGREAMAPGQEEQLGIEAEALDALLLEDNSASLPAEGLEAALGIHEGQAEREAHQPVENDAGKFAEGGLVDRDEAAVEGARADGNVVGFERTEEILGLCVVGCKIILGDKVEWGAGFDLWAAKGIC
ncbi:MAG: hypothetical protein ACRD2R_08070, partial [Terriglobales bacterium]